jgi:hypothetical protein
MGNTHPESVNFLIHGGEFSDIFVIDNINKAQPSAEWIEYMTNCQKKADKTSNISKREQILTQTKNIIANKLGINLPDEYTHVTEDVINKDLEQFKGIDILKLLIVATGPCSQFIKSLISLLKREEQYFCPMEINFIVISSKYNNKGLFDSLYLLSRTCNDYNIDLNIREFNTFSSMGRGSKEWVTNASDVNHCYTSGLFFTKLSNMSFNYGIARIITQYALMVNGDIIEKVVPKINSSIVTMAKISNDDVKSYDLLNTVDSITKYINKLITKEDGILEANYNICNTLCEDLKRIIQCAQSILYRVEMDFRNGIITNDEAQLYNKKLYSIKNWFSRQIYILACSLVTFPIKNLAAVLIMNNDKVFEGISAYAINSGECVSIVPNKPNQKTFKLTHYIVQDHELAKDKMEDMVQQTLDIVCKDEYDDHDDLHSLINNYRWIF